jgi:serine/threonine protein kinase
VLSSHIGSDGARIRRFEQEARAASALSHPNVCVVHALGETSDGQPYIAMEYIEGQTLRHLVQTQPPTLKRALDIAIQVTAGVGAAHAIGIVHRDLKPENVIVRRTASRRCWTSVSPSCRRAACRTTRPRGRWCKRTPVW